jgi:hypothetical protein
VWQHFGDEERRSADGSVKVWPRRRRSQPAAPDAAEPAAAAPLQPVAPPPKPLRLAADANLRAGESPRESLQSIRRAQVGRWWIQLRPWSPGFRAEAHTLSGPPGVWVGELRPTLREATADAIAMIDVLRHE